MNQALLLALTGIVGAFFGVAFMLLRGRLLGTGYLARAEQTLRDAETESARLLRDAEIDAKQALLHETQEHERELKEQHATLAAKEKRLRQRESDANRRNAQLDKHERELKKRAQVVEKAHEKARTRADEVEQRVREAEAALQEVAGLSREEARRRLIEVIETDARKEVAERIQAAEARAHDELTARTQTLLATSVQRLASSFVAEKAVRVIELPSDEMKGRIIGREGRNIRAIEAATGVDIIVDDTPEMVVISAFDPVRREVAALALERLMADGRIHPARIEEAVLLAGEDIAETVRRAGEQATFDLGLHGVHAELIKLIGALKYRSILGQNSWQHSVETAAIAGLLAEELGLGPKRVTQARRAGILHDIGKAVDHEKEGDHAAVGAEYARRFGEKPSIVEAIAQHHADTPNSILAVLVQSADTISKARPGARREQLTPVIKRLEEMEKISQSFAGVQRAWVMQAGREVRVMVNYGEVSEQESFMLSRDIARRIESELTYPGEVRVVVVREARATEIAR